MEIVMTTHAEMQLRVRAPIGTDPKAVAEQAQAKLRKKPVNIRDGLNIFRIVRVLCGEIVLLLREDGGRYIVVTALTNGQFDTSLANGKFGLVEAS